MNGASMRYPRRILAFTVGATLGLLALCSLISWDGPHSLGATWTALTLPAELRGATFTSGTEPGKTYHMDNMRLVRERRMIQGPAGDAIATLAAKQTIRTPVTSPDGKKAAFAAQVSAADALSSWHVKVLGLGPERDLGPGIAPFFLDTDHVARFTPQGIVVRDLRTGVDALALSHMFTGTAFHAAYDSSTHTAAFAEGPERVGVYHLYNDASQFLYAYTGDYVSYAFGNGALYVLREGKGGTAVVKVMDGKERTIYTFPKSLGIVDLSL